jgi:hypothetical protein
MSPAEYQVIEMKNLDDDMLSDMLKDFLTWWWGGSYCIFSFRVGLCLFKDNVPGQGGGGGVFTVAAKSSPKFLL